MISEISNVMTYQESRPSRVINPPTYPVTKADVKLVPIGVSQGCSLMGSKYHQPVAVGAELTGSIKLSGTFDSLESLKVQSHDFKITQTIYGTNQAGYLPLFPKYSMSEYLKFETTYSPLIVDFMNQVDSEDVYGIKEISKMSPAEKLVVAKNLAQDILNYQLDPDQQKPFYDALLWSEPNNYRTRENIDAELQEYQTILLSVFQEVTKSMPTLPRKDALLNIARQLNHFATYEYGVWEKDPAIAKVKSAIKMKMLISTPLLMSHSVLALGYDSNAHISIAETDLLVKAFALKVKLSKDPVQKAQFLNALKAMYDENVNSQSAPQYWLSDEAKSIIEKTRAENP
ncbi:MAG: hypothetical protein EOP05_09675 [Proteobacteria bacterium]|nr:MAG: hypothetical protein EOP05_09675 [Pseudomonadota bacterium]